MDNLLSQQLALYPTTMLPTGQALHWVEREGVSVLVLQSGAQNLHEWTIPLRWGAVLDYLTNQNSTPAIIAPIGLTKNCVFDPQQSLLKRGTEIIKLTDKEQATLLYLYQAARPVLREELVEKVWQYHADVQTHTVETLIWRLRQKLETNPEAPELLITTPQGYALQII